MSGITQSDKRDAVSGRGPDKRGPINSYLDVLDTLSVVRLHLAWATSRTNRNEWRRVAHFVGTAPAARSTCSI